MKFKIDNLQYCNWSRKIFEINREAGLDAVHVTIVYHEDFDELLTEIKKWEKLVNDNSDLIFLGKSYKDIEKANKENKTAIFFGFQNCSPIEDDIVEYDDGTEATHTQIAKDVTAFLAWTAEPELEERKSLGVKTLFFLVLLFFLLVLLVLTQNTVVLLKTCFSRVLLFL